MRYPEFGFVDFAKGDVRARNHVVQLREALAARDNGGAVNSYITVYRFPEAYREHCERFRSVAGYAGPCYADYLPIDIDRENDLDAAHRAALAVSVRVQEYFDVRPDQLRYFFSGAKGFHVLIPTPLMGEVRPSALLPLAFRSMAAAIASLAGEEIDLKIYDVNRLFRLPDTKHAGSGLWKVELTWEEFSTLTIDAIRSIAKGPRRLKWDPHDLEPIDGLAEFFAKHMYEAEQGGSRPRSSRLAAGDDGVAGTIARILAPYYVPGRRHELVLAFAGYAAKAHLPRETALGVIDHVAAGDDELEDRTRAVSDTYDRVRDGREVRGFTELSALLTADDLEALKNALGDVRRPREAPRQEAEERVTLRNVYDADQAGMAYLRYVRELAQRRVQIGIPSLDRAMRGLMPGTVAVLIAKARVGKSAFAQNVRRYVAKTVPDGASVFFSLEMPVELVWERDAQFVFNLTGHEVEQSMRGASESDAEDMIAAVSYTIPRAYTVPVPGLSLEEMQEYCTLIRAAFGQRISLVIVDYLSLVRAQGRDLYTSTSNIARGLKPLAKAIEAPVLMLAQVRRRGSDGEKIDGSTPPTLEDARDSGAIEEGADFVIGAWRPKLEQAGDDVIGLKLLKNRLGVSGGDVMCRIDWKRLAITELAEDPA